MSMVDIEVMDSLVAAIKTGSPEEQARAMVRVADAAIDARANELATKADIQLIRLDMQKLKADMAGLILKCTFGLAALMVSLLALMASFLA